MKLTVVVVAFLTSVVAAFDHLIQVNGPDSCGGNRASLDITSDSGPNGHIDWMNCGFEDAGWNPPHVEVNDLVLVELAEAFKDPNTPFLACSPYVDSFYQHSRNKFPAIILAAFAMQESSCNPETVGGGGEQGIMQLSPDKCIDAPNGNCQDVNFNIETAASFFAERLASENWNVFAAVGIYNGWKLGLKKEEAFAAADTDCCWCQNNGDYLMQFFNGWLLNVNPYDPNHPLGKYFNLKDCGQ